MKPSSSQWRPSPVTLYDAAIEKIRSIQAEETTRPGFDPALQTLLLSHGRKTARAVLWFHGYTAAVPQFAALAQLCFERGDTVLVPSMPHHGFLDRMSAHTSQVRADELVRYAADMVDLMHGLGDEIVVGGLSMGGALTCWVAQERADVHTAIVIAPFLGARVIPTRLTRPVAYATQWLRDVRQWWDPVKKEAMLGPRYGYVQHSTHSLGQILKLGFQVYDRSRRTPPAVKNIWMVLNDNDHAVNNQIAMRQAERWRKSGASCVRSVHFAAELGLPHDLISIDQPHAQPQLVYAELMKMIDREETPCTIEP